MKKAFLVVGPESSGTKLVTQLFCMAGCAGDFEHKQRLDDFVVGGLFPREMKGKDIVFRRSVPHGGEFPDLLAIERKFKEREYEIGWVVIFRDWYANICSAPKYGHKRSIREAQNRLPEEWKYIAGYIPKFENFYFLLSSQLFVKPRRALFGLSVWAGLGLIQHSSIIKDADEKYF